MQKTKKLLSLFIAIAILLTSMTVYAAENITVVFNAITIKVNGNFVKTSNFLYNSTTYVPLREISTMLNKVVTWDGNTNTAYIDDNPVESEFVKDTNTYTIYPRTETMSVEIGKVKIVVNRKPISEETILYNGTTYVPLRAVSTMLDKDVTWDEQTKTAGINDLKSDNTGAIENKPNEADTANNGDIATNTVINAPYDIGSKIYDLMNETNEYYVMMPDYYKAQTTAGNTPAFFDRYEIINQKLCKEWSELAELLEYYYKEDKITEHYYRMCKEILEGIDTSSRMAKCLELLKQNGDINNNYYLNGNDEVSKRQSAHGRMLWVYDTYKYDLHHLYNEFMADNQEILSAEATALVLPKPNIAIPLDGYKITSEEQADAPNTSTAEYYTDYPTVPDFAVIVKDYYVFMEDEISEEIAEEFNGIRYYYSYRRNNDNFFDIDIDTSTMLGGIYERRLIQEGFTKTAGSAERYVWEYAKGNIIVTFGGGKPHMGPWSKGEGLLEVHGTAMYPGSYTVTIREK